MHVLGATTRMLGDVRAAIDGSDKRHTTVMQLLDRWIRALMPEFKHTKRPMRRAVFVVMATLHLALIAAYIAYPFVFTARQHDWVFLLFTACCVVHWFVLAGECWMTYVEKKLKYDGYTLGSSPMRNWLFDVMPAPAAVVVMGILGGAMAASFMVVVLRNLVFFVSKYAVAHVAFHG